MALWGAGTPFLMLRCEPELAKESLEARTDGNQAESNRQTVVFLTSASSSARVTGTS